MRGFAIEAQIAVPSPLVGEGISAGTHGHTRVRGLSPQIFVRVDGDPHPALRARKTLSIPRLSVTPFYSGIRADGVVGIAAAVVIITIILLMYLHAEGL